MWKFEQNEVLCSPETDENFSQGQMKKSSAFLKLCFFFGRLANTRSLARQNTSSDSPTPSLFFKVLPVVLSWPACFFWEVRLKSCLEKCQRTLKCYQQITKKKQVTLPETNSSPLKMDPWSRKGDSGIGNPPILGAAVTALQAEICTFRRFLEVVDQRLQVVILLPLWGRCWGVAKNSDTYMYMFIYIYIYVYIYIPVEPHEAVAEVSRIGNV